MTIDEAIELYRRIAKSYADVGDTDSAFEIGQLVEWLRQARGSESASRWYTSKLREVHRAERKLLNENAKLAKRNSELLELFRCAVGAYEGVIEMMPDSYTKNVAKRGAADLREHLREFEGDDE